LFTTGADLEVPLRITPSSLLQTTARVNYKQTLTVSGGILPSQTLSVSGFNAAGFRKSPWLWR
jgi:hypothetical protein